VESRKTAIAVVLLLTLSGVRSDVLAGALVVEGQARVVDNTTLEIWGQRIRLAGITAPDPNSEAGGAGKRYLEGLVSHVTVRCETTGPSYQTETPGRCVAGRQDLAASLVEMGYARRLVQQSQDR